MSDRYILIELHGRTLTPSQPAMFDTENQANDEMARRLLKALHLPYENHTFETAQAYMKENSLHGLYRNNSEINVQGKPLSWIVLDRYPMHSEYLGHAVTEDEERDLRSGKIVTFDDCVTKDGKRCALHMHYTRHTDGTYGLEPTFDRFLNPGGNNDA